MITRPMKAATVTDDDIHAIRNWPIYASAKLDGWRTLIHPELGPVQQSFIPVTNNHIRVWMERWLESTYLDFELVTIDEFDHIKPYTQIQSDLSTAACVPHDFRCLVFDQFQYPEHPFHQRLDHLYKTLTTVKNYMRKPEDRARIQFVEQKLCYTPEEVLEFYAKCLEEGHEGIVLRHTEGSYKSGRSTLRQEWMLKRKPWEDDEAVIVDFYELFHNENEDVRSLHGTAKRGSSKAGLVPAGTLGGFVVTSPAHPEWGEFDIGGGKGLDHALRQEVWDNKEEYLGRKMVFRYMAYGMKDKPRFPGYKAWRTD